LTSFNTFRLIVYVAFKGTPANISVSDFDGRWLVKVSSLDEKASVTAETGEAEMLTTSACQAFAYQLVRILISRYAGNETRGLPCRS
jgi:hypothetical protein